MCVCTAHTHALYSIRTAAAVVPITIVPAISSQLPRLQSYEGMYMYTHRALRVGNTSFVSYQTIPPLLRTATHDSCPHASFAVERKNSSEHPNTTPLMPRYSPPLPPISRPLQPAARNRPDQTRRHKQVGIPGTGNWGIGRRGGCVRLWSSDERPSEVR